MVTATLNHWHGTYAIQQSQPPTPQYGDVVADFSWLQVSVTTVGSGALSAVVNGAFSISARRSAEHEREQQALDAARERSVGDVGRAIDWLDYHGKDAHGMDGDQVTNSLPLPDYTSVLDVRSALRRVSREHRDVEVRKIGRKLADSVDSAYGDVARVAQRGVPATPPSKSDFIEWKELGDQLIEALHGRADAS